MTRSFTALLLLAAATIPATAHAQMTAGAKGGLTFVNIVHEPSAEYGIDSTAEAGLLAGGFVTFLDAKRISIQADAVFAQHKVDFGVSLQEFTSFEIPVIARYRIWSPGDWTVRATGGITNTIILSAEETTSGSEPFDVKDSFESVITSAIVGGQAEWKRRWLFEGRLIFGLTEVDTQPVPGFTSRLRGFEVTAGYRFW